MRLKAQSPTEIRYELVNSENPHELAALQHAWDDFNHEREDDYDDD